MRESYRTKVLIFLDGIYETINTKEGCLIFVAAIIAGVLFQFIR